MSEGVVDPLVPRPIDRPTELPLHGDIDPEVADQAKIFAAPDDPADWPAWRAQLHRWRASAKTRFPQAISGTSARKLQGEGPSAWPSRCYSVALVWLWDERLFDHDALRFTPDRFLDETAAPFGGFDGVVLWHAYPVIGLDERNQFDFYRDVPDLDQLIAAFQRRGVRVFVDYNPWDTGTRREPRSDEEALAALVGELRVDGVFLDTMREGSERFVATMRALDPPPVLEGESRVPLDRIGDHQLSWAQWFADTRAPGVMAAHWFERRHLQHHTRRWNRDHSDELQSAWMNGNGTIVWDAVFGSWVGWNDRDRSTLRRMVRAQRALSRVLVDGEWTPLTDGLPEAIEAGVFVSRFELGEQTLWTIVNRGDQDYRGPIVDTDRRDGTWLEVCAASSVTGPADPIHVPARGVAGLLRVTGAVPAGITELVATNGRDRHAPDTTFPARLPVRIEPPRSAKGPPEAVILLPPGEHHVDVRYRLREPGIYGEAPFVEEWKPLPPRLHAEITEQHTVTFGRVAVALREVTGDDCTPLTGVTLDEAREYAASIEARLPTEFEWQVAAADPAFERVEPLVWNWTESEHSDGVTRFAILKGGCAHQAEGSVWYFDGGPRPPEFSAKLLLAGPDLQRSPSIGFRLAWDLPDV